MRAPLLALVLGLSIFGGPFVPGDDIQVVELTREGAIYVSFTFTNGFTTDVREALRSGLKTEITYDIELRRPVPAWFDATVARVTVIASAQYDNLTRDHQLSRTVDGRGDEVMMTRDEEVVRQWLTSLERLKVFDVKAAGLEPNVEYYVLVRARTKPRTGWFFLWPFDRGVATGSARFTFIPS